jgi:hypothetical protein
MPTPRSVAQIKSNLLRPALTSHFEVEIPFQKISNKLVNNIPGMNLNSSDIQKLNLSCSEASLPGSSLATLEINNDFTGVTERHAHRRIYDDRMDFTFYVDAEKYLPIVFFESWIKYIAGEGIAEDTRMRGNVGSKSRNYFYRVRYPNDYIIDQGLKIIKFERDYQSKLEYEFIGAYPIGIQSIPVSYDSSSLLKCTVSMTYIRYIITDLSTTYPPDPKSVADNNSTPNYEWTSNPNIPLQEAQFSAGGVPDVGSSGNTVFTSESEGPQSTLGQIYQNI